MLDVKKLLVKLIEASSLDYNHPVGTVYSTTDASFNPNTAWGGTWEPLPEGYVLMSGSDSGSYVVGTDATSSGFKEYGDNTKNIQTSNLPAHSHTIGSEDRYFLAMNKSPDRSITRTNVASGSAKTVYTGENAIVRSSATDSTGSGSAFNVMQKSIAVYTWIRTA